MAEHQNLALRESLKEIYRKKLRRENDENSDQKFSLPPKVNYGSFFGPSETIFTTKHINTNTNFTVNKLTSKEFPKLEKIQKIKEARDYSFLLSENHELKPPEKPPATHFPHGHQVRKPIKRLEIKKPVSGLVKIETFKTIPANVKKLSVDQKLKASKKRAFEQNLKDDDYWEGEKAPSIVRRMFNTQRFAGRDDSDRVTEASFRGIAKEEKRSARLAKKEDEEQLRIIIQEEKRIHIAKRRKQTLV